MSDASDPWDRLILVAGHRRGGTTWVGHMLSQADDVCYLFEPFNLRTHRDSPYQDLVRLYNRRRDFWVNGGGAVAAAPEAAGLRSHLGWLATKTFPSRPSTLMIKQPDTERVPFLAKALGVDELVYVRRHPLGIINSFHDRDLLKGWDVDDEFAQMAAAFAGLGVSLDLAKCKTSQDKLAALIHTRFSLLPQLLTDATPQRHGLLSYEDLCTDGLPAFEKVLTSLGLGLGPDAEARLEASLNVANRSRSGFHSVDVNSLSRAAAWRRELHPKQIEGFASFMAAAGASRYPVPGNGLAPLTAAERAAGRRSYWKRRLDHTTTVRRAKALLGRGDEAGPG